MTELTKAIIEEEGLTSSWRAKKSENWEVVSESLHDYDEGNVTKRYIFRNKQTNEYWAYYETSNSWSEWGDDENEEPVRVYPKQVLVTQYVTEE